MDKIKRLTKEELEEGLTLEFVNGVNMKRNYTPIQLLPGDEPLPMLLNSKGYWGKPVGEDFLQNEDGSLIIFTERECRVGRARYLMNYSEQEKQERAEKLITQWKKLIKEQVQSLFYQEDEMRKILHTSEWTPMRGYTTREQAQKAFPKLSSKNKIIRQLYKEDKLTWLLMIFGIVKYEQPVLYAHINEMESMLQVPDFMDKEVEICEGDLLLKYAKKEVEKQY